MSGSILGLIEAVAGVIVLDGMVFTDFALPERVQHGGQQQLTTHKLPGGARVIDNMGDDPAQITWSGLWLGLDASVQRMELEALRTAGEPVNLNWSDQSFTVVIAECKYEEEHTGRRIRYHITCTVVPDTQDDETGDTGTDAIDTGTGDTPDTASDAQDAGQRQITRARSNSAASPTATQSTAVQSNADVMMAAVNARQSAGIEARQLGAAP